MDLATIRATLTKLRAKEDIDLELVECIDSLAEIVEEHQRVLRNHARELLRTGDNNILGIIGRL